LCYFQALNANYTNQTDQYDGPVIIGDTRQTGKMGAEHLMGLGFVHFAYCGIHPASTIKQTIDLVDN